jgi:hypothetical protein
MNSKRIPIATVLAKVAGDDYAAKAREIGTYRQVLWGWRNGRVPAMRHAKRLAKLTGYSVQQIRGTRRVIYE